MNLANRQENLLENYTFSPSSCGKIVSLGSVSIHIHWVILTSKYRRMMTVPTSKKRAGFPTKRRARGCLLHSLTLHLAKTCIHPLTRMSYQCSHFHQQKGVYSVAREIWWTRSTKIPHTPISGAKPSSLTLTRSLLELPTKVSFLLMEACPLPFPPMSKAGPTLHQK
jgi:hypothetical protein